MIVIVVHTIFAKSFVYLAVTRINWQNVLERSLLEISRYIKLTQNYL
ncbi:MAG: hypothetical protein QNJ51_31145 [Calothrix sp. MO_167.B12]|nr:hypothetical protein [Calothrix sp. MO_167.B12]